MLPGSILCCLVAARGRSMASHHSAFDQPFADAEGGLAAGHQKVAILPRGQRPKIRHVNQVAQQCYAHAVAIHTLPAGVCLQPLTWMPLLIDSLRNPAPHQEPQQAHQGKADAYEYMSMLTSISETLWSRQIHSVALFHSLSSMCTLPCT